MKKRAFVKATLLMFSMIVAAQVARAEQAMLVNIPFEFAAGNAVLPAGEYRVEKLGSNSAVLLIRCSDPGASVVLTTNAAVANDLQTESKLVFNRYGSRYFLSQVWSRGSSSGRQLLKSRREKEIAQVAKIETKAEVTLVARLTTTHP